MLIKQKQLKVNTTPSAMAGFFIAHATEGNAFGSHV
tara:strand:+ start:92 stop:199 length:108 start_codon:yes stop_codon:yes gene_type:complete